MSLRAVIPVFFVAACAGSVSAGEVLPSWGGRLSVPNAATSLGPVAFNGGWEALRVVGGIERQPDGSRSFAMQKWSGDRHVETIRGTLAYEFKDGLLFAKYRFRVLSDIYLKQLCVNAFLPLGEFSCGSLRTDASSVPVPSSCRGGQILRRTASSFEIANTNATRRLKLTFDTPTDIMVQDDRHWGKDTLTLRLVLGREREYRAGEAFALDFAMSDGGRMSCSPDASGFAIKAGKDWLPVRLEPDIEPGSALDFSRLRGTDAPAGCHGRILSRGGHFVFADSPDVPRRFYGVNICGYANVPDPASVRPFARRLAMTGYNAIRFHHHECALVEKDGITLNAERMRRFDALAAACIEEGIYLTTDLFVSRRPIAYRSLGIDLDGNVGADEFRDLVLAHEGTYANFIRFARAFLGHVNPFTGRSLAREPALGWLSLVNEGNLGNHNMQFMSRHPCFAEKWRAWLATRRKTDPDAWNAISETLPKTLADRTSPHVAAYTLFMQHLEMDFAKRVRRFLLEEMGCMALTTDMNGWHYPAAYQLPRAQSHDYVDFHFYVDHPEFLETPWRLPSTCANVNPVANRQMGAPQRAIGRVFGRPLAVSEFNYSAPGRFRGVGGIAAGTLGGLQDWDAMWRFAWSHDEWGIQKPGCQRLTYFDMCADPLGLAAERAAICLFLRRDVAPLGKTCALVASKGDLLSPATSPMLQTDFAWAAWYARVGTALDTATPKADWSISYPGDMARSGDDMARLLFGTSERPRRAGDGQVEIDGENGRFVVATPRTCGGFAERGVLRAGALVADLGNTAATVWVSALDDQPVGSSKRLLAVHLTDLQNSGMRYFDRSRRILTDWGSLPHLMRRGSASVRIAAGAGRWRCYALSMGGGRRYEIPCAAEGETVAFKADVSSDPESATWLYELARE